MSSDLIAVSSMQPKVLAAAVLGTSSVDLLAPAADHASIVKTAVACNTTNLAATITLTITKAAGSTVTVLNALTIAAGDTTQLTELVGAMLGPGDKVSGASSTTAAIAVVLTGTDNS